ncbi:MAG: UDP-N-acetylmuramoyl-L-alanyl-D-glutamate--2,6-diaminopimelate ligase [Hyphomicrobiales bacterium]|nr:MAG: UDP-N-acetylmuramoyl-L-alanyl-D-glutamate--2,6-diaminopimelate ligase [Hyphomicrobiales bacterium]
MQLKALLCADAVLARGDPDTMITGITADSREVKPGFLFAALAGAKADGARFIADAMARGAVVVLGRAGVEAPGSVAVVHSAEPRRVLALMAARFHPGQPETAVAVTGTSGKTSVAEFTRQLFAACGRQAASLGTIGLVKPDGGVYGSLTTPDPVTLHRTLAGLAREGITHLAFEASSHGLDQHRLDGVMLRAAGFTNLGRDHLDYHPTMEAYLEAKLRLFRDLLPVGAPAIINADDAYSQPVIDAAKAAGRDVRTVGRGGTFLALHALERDGFDQVLDIAHAGKRWRVRLPLIGDYQASNALVAAGMAIATGEAPDTVLPALEGLKGVKGRLEIAGRVRGGLIVIDYAHKPEALDAALRAVKAFSGGRVVCVFGCGGDRDKGKRPIMGEIARRHATTVIITDDNPRSEDPAAIRAAIINGAREVRDIGDRAEAIKAGIRMLGARDVLLIAGKGHETGQIVGSTVIPFSDHDAVAAALAEKPLDV